MKKKKCGVLAVFFAGVIFLPCTNQLKASASEHPREKLSAYTTYFNAIFRSSAGVSSP